MICSNCFEETNLDGQTTACCQALPLDGNDTEVTVVEEFIDSLAYSKKQKTQVLEIITAMSPDSKKRRKSTPSNAWPGKKFKGKDNIKQYRKAKKGKSAAPTVTTPLSVTGQCSVEIRGLTKVPHTVHGTDKKDARRKARSWLRSQGTSITFASSIQEHDNGTVIVYD